MTSHDPEKVFDNILSMPLLTIRMVVVVLMLTMLIMISSQEPKCSSLPDAL